MTNVGPTKRRRFIIFMVQKLPKPNTIHMKKKGGVYYIPIKINGVQWNLFSIAAHLLFLGRVAGNFSNLYGTIS